MRKQKDIITKTGVTNISIKSEMDSRCILYPLMRCILPFGSILLITNNKQVSRLIDNEFEGDFRNFHILIDFEGSTDELLKDAGINQEEYTFVIYDNVGVVEQDKLIIPIGPIISESFESDLLFLGEDANTHILRFGKQKTSKETTNKKYSKKTEEDDYTDKDSDDIAKSKFQPKKIDVKEKLRRLPNLTFPKFEDIEFMESNKKFFIIDNNFSKFFFTIFQDIIGINESNFLREVGRKDESSSSIEQREASGENNIVIASK